MAKLIKGQIETPAVPDFPNPQEAYSRSIASQTNNSLRLFFTKLHNNLRSLFGPAGIQFVDAPNGLFFSTQEQTVAAINTRYDITFNQTYLSSNVSVVDSSKITCAIGGVYNFQFSAQVHSGSSSNKSIFLMINRDGTDIRYTTRIDTLISNSQHMSTVWDFNIDVSAGSYIKLRWACDSTDIKLETIAATTPHTGVPSVVLSVRYVAPLPATLPTPP